MDNDPVNDPLWSLQSHCSFSLLRGFDEDATNGKHRREELNDNVKKTEEKNNPVTYLTFNCFLYGARWGAGATGAVKCVFLRVCLRLGLKRSASIMMSGDVKAT